MVNDGDGSGLSIGNDPGAKGTECRGCGVGRKGEAGRQDHVDREPVGLLDIGGAGQEADLDVEVATVGDRECLRGGTRSADGKGWQGAARVHEG